MNTIKTEHLLSQVNGLLKSYEKIAHATGENFNIFTVMGMESNEVKTHSAIIGEFLNPKGSHGLNDIPLKLFIEQVKIEIIKNQPTLDENLLEKNNIDDKLSEIFALNTNFSKSKIEESIGKIDEQITEGGRIDILVHDNNRAFVIENKIYANEQTNQLGRYNKAFPNAPILYLTLFGDKPNSAENLIENENYFIISYKECILKWIENCVKEAVKFPMLREVINQYIYLIKKLTHQTTNNELKMEIKDIIKNNLKASSEIYKNYLGAVNNIVGLFWKDLEELLRNELNKNSSIKWNVYSDIKKDVIKSSFNHLLISIDNDAVAFFYCRYHEKNGEINYGIIINPKKNFNKIKGTKIYEDLEIKDFKTGEQSVIYSKNDNYNIFNLDVLTNYYSNKDKTVLGEITCTFMKFIEDNITIYKEVLAELKNINSNI